MGRRIIRRVRAELRSVRVRILAVVLAFMSLGLVLAGAATFTVQLSQLNARVNAELRQEMFEFQQLAMAGPDGDRKPFTSLDDLFLAYLEAGVPGEYETMMGVIDGEAAYLIGGNRPFELNRAKVLGLISMESRPGWTVTHDIYLGDRLVRMSMISALLEADPREGVMVVAIDISSQRAEVYRSMRTYGLVALGTLVFSGLAGWVVAGRLMRPVSALRAATGAITADDLGRRVPVSPDADSDLTELALTFNTMLDRLEEGFVGQRQFLDDVAHELRTPLTIIQGNLELVDEDDPEDVAATRDLVMDELERMQRLVDDLLTLARAGRPGFLHLQPMPVPDLAQELLGRLRTLGDREWSCTTPAAGQFVADRQRVIQAVVQLAANAVKFSADGDAVSVRIRWAQPSDEVSQRCAATEHYLAIAVRDTGIGIAPEDQERIFERFSRAESAQRIDGSGLGLSIVSAIADAHGGTVELESEVGVGSTFTLWLPAREAADIDQSEVRAAEPS